MSIYTPDNWVIIKIDNGQESIYYKVLAGWSGGYLDGDSWQLNSGIVKIEESENYYDFIGSSGSVYHCHKRSERLGMMTSVILSKLLDKFPNKISHVDVGEIKL